LTRGHWRFRQSIISVYTDHLLTKSIGYAPKQGALANTTYTCYKNSKTRFTLGHSIKVRTKSLNIHLLSACPHVLSPLSPLGNQAEKSFNPEGIEKQN
jgi:hypothetical protein